MCSLILTLALLLAPLVFATAQNSQERTPPGGDMVGSDRTIQRGDIRSSPTASPDANQRMTNSGGTSSGYENPPAFSGTSTHEGHTQQQTIGPTGIQGSTPATAGRRRARSQNALRSSSSAHSSARGTAQKKKPIRKKGARQGTNEAATAPPR